MVDFQENNQIVYEAVVYFQNIYEHTMLYIQRVQNVEIILHYRQRQKILL
jgi:hypothetical protein